MFLEECKHVVKKKKKKKKKPKYFIKEIEIYSDEKSSDELYSDDQY